MTTFASSRHTRAISTATAYTPICRATFTRGDESATLPPTGGELSQDARRSLVWGGQLAFDLPTGSTLLPSTPADLLTPFGTICEIVLGVKLADGSEETVGYGTYVVTAARAERSGDSKRVTLDLADLGLKVSDYRFETPVIVPPGDVADAVNAVILDRLGFDPGLAASGENVGTTIFGLDVGKNPWDELVALADSRGLRLRYNRDGDLELTEQPSYSGVFPTPLTGELGVDIAFESRPPNVIVARGEPADGSAPAFYVAMDDDEASPTFAGAAAGDSAYGRITQFYASPYLTSDAQAETTAKSILARKAGAGASRTITRAFDPLSDIDDLVEIGGVPLAVDAVSIQIGGATVIEVREVTT